MNATPLDQRNAYKGSPPRPWITVRIRAIDDSIHDLELLADTGSPCAVIFAEHLLTKFGLRQGPDMKTRMAAPVSFSRWLAAACITAEDCQFAPTNGDELSVPTEHVPSLIPGRIGNDLKNVPCAESEVQVEKASSQSYLFYHCPHQAAVNFGGCVHGCRKTELMAVIFGGESYSTRFDEPPQASDDDTCILVEREYPVKLTPRE